jgi:hypothetical protein
VFSPMEASFAIFMAETFKSKVAEQRAVTYSGVDQLLLDSQTIEADRFIEKMKTLIPEPVPFSSAVAPES